MLDSVGWWCFMMLKPFSVRSGKIIPLPQIRIDFVRNYNKIIISYYFKLLLFLH
jgi:hypothetical protein